jgi:hypothetical protein
MKKQTNSKAKIANAAAGNDSVTSGTTKRLNVSRSSWGNYSNAIVHRGRKRRTDLSFKHPGFLPRASPAVIGQTGCLDPIDHFVIKDAQYSLNLPIMLLKYPKFPCKAIVS